MAKNARFQSVADMVQCTSADAELAEEIRDHLSQRRLIKHLIAHRVKRDMSQKDVAAHFGSTQSRISKLESSSDEEIRLGDLRAYADAVGLQLRIVIAPRNRTAVEEIKHHALRIKQLLQRLVGLAESDPEIVDGVSRFVCIETPVNLLKIVVNAARQIPARVLQRAPGFVIEDECRVCEQEDENADSTAPLS